MKNSRPFARTALLAICGGAGVAAASMVCPQIGGAQVRAAEEPPHPASLDEAIIAAAKRHGVPEHLVRRIIMRESKYNPLARNHLYWGLMQISYPTARSMGFKGTPQELLNPVVNLRYAVPYLANAFVIAGRREDAAVRLYAAGYYFTARTRGLLSELRTADSTPLAGAPEDQPPLLAANAVAQPPQSQGIFGALFGPGSQPQPQPTQVAAYSADASQMQRPAPATSAAAPAGTFDGASVAMVAGKNGDLAPPKKWVHDGGTTVIARGEQGLDQVASRDTPAADETSHKASHHKSHKILAFAALDVPPSSAQAYAATPGQDPRFGGAASAIAQATSGAATPTAQPVAQVAGGQPAGPNLDAQGQPVDAVPSAALTTSADETKPVKKRVHHARRHKAPDATTQEAQVEKPALRDLPVPAPAAQ